MVLIKKIIIEKKEIEIEVNFPIYVKKDNNIYKITSQKQYHLISNYAILVELNHNIEELYNLEKATEQEWLETKKKLIQKIKEI